MNEKTLLNFEERQIWQDREVRFDVPNIQIQLINGEKVLDKIINVEDTKGGTGDVGTLTFTNLRLIWFCVTNVKINLSVGYDCFVNFEVKNATSKLAGDINAIYVKCKFNNNRFEFVFNALGCSNTQLLSTFQAIYKSYDKSRIYRDMKLKAFLTNEKTFNLLENEKIIESFNQMGNVASDNIINGNFILTNIRLIFYSTVNDRFNISLPWIQVKNIKVKDSKFGKSVLIETYNPFFGNNFNLKFEDAENKAKELKIMYSKFTDNAIYGVDFIKPIENTNDKNIFNNPNSSINNYKLETPSGTSLTKSTNSLNNIANESINSNFTQKNIEKNTNEYSQFINKNKSHFDVDVEVVDSNYFNEHSNILYYMTTNDKKNTANDVIYSMELGLAIEKPPFNTTLENLWKIIN